MARTRISTTVDSALLSNARRVGAGVNDAELIDAALSALLDRYRRAEIDDAYAAAYDRSPPEKSDEWGDLASFRRGAAAS